jgi:CheY-like chemotaxis protein
MARVLVIDDNAAVRLVARAMLQATGHDVEEAGGGAEAVEAFRGQPADLVLCDVFMPEKDGLQTIRELRALEPGLKVIAMSGVGSRTGVDVLAIARAFGAAEALRKPFDLAALTGAVERALRTPALA